MCERIARIVSEGLKNCEDLDTFLVVKPVVLAFEQTLQVSVVQVAQHQSSRLPILGSKGYGFDVSALTRLLMTLFERYSNLLQRKFSAEFDQVRAFLLISRHHSGVADEHRLYSDCVRRRSSAHDGAKSRGV